MASPTKVSEELLEKKHLELARKFNLDSCTVKQSWDSFKEISSKYSLVGEPLHWFACSIYAVSRKNNEVNPIKKKDIVNITHLLRACDLSFKQFLQKIQAWASMTKLTSDTTFMDNIRKEDQHFHVSLNVYKQYQLWFIQIFQEPEMESKAKENSQKPTAMQLYDFVWTLFIFLKSKLNYGSDLVKCIQIMASCIDISFANVLNSKMTYLLNENNECLPANWQQETFTHSEKSPSVVSTLLGANNDSFADTLHTKEYVVIKCIEQLIGDNILKGDVNCQKLFEKGRFDYNFFTIKSLYDKHIVRAGSFDERIFLGEAQRQVLLKVLYANGESILETPKTNSSREAMIRDTPLTGRSYIAPRDPIDSNKPSADSLTRINKMLEGLSPSPSESLRSVFGECSDDPEEKISEIVTKLGEMFTEKFNEDDGNGVLTIGTTLFYKLLENILNFERNNTKDLSVYTDKNLFHECLFACALQIVLDARKSSKAFPWILNVLDIQPSNFVRVIELVVRSTDDFSRDTIKHLSSIEESILDKYIWMSSSGFWMELSKIEIPKFEEVALPGTIDTTTSNNKKFSTQTPGTSSTIETFQSPVRNIKPGQSLLNLNRATTHFLVTDTNGARTLIPIEHHNQQVVPEPTKQKKVSGIGIILRKLYHLVHVRIDHLCKTLDIVDVDLKRKIWTVFEYSVMKHTHLFRDRHLDQLIMCAVYIICRITEQADKKFYDIMKCYRFQPQAKSEVYRVVYIKTNDDGEVENSNLIVFYNEIYVGIMKKFVAKFSDSKASCENLTLSTFPSTKLQMASPKRQISNTVYLRTHESPVQESPGDKYHSYYFSRSAATDLRDLNNAINKKRPMSELPDGKIIKKVATRKMQTLIEERKVQNNTE